jgi:hypothetical protein
MADDPQFSRSQTYFWALQAYKLFEVGVAMPLTNELIFNFKLGVLCFMEKKWRLT